MKPTLNPGDRALTALAAEYRAAHADMAAALPELTALRAATARAEERYEQPRSRSQRIVNAVTSLAHVPYSDDLHQALMALGRED